ncbi:hypothetical protein ACFU9X_07900 [Streptomyces atratus]|uniref:hypothetical protein n=1 Tax=Streptomyces atratus TaxID=1893 RepID=UPI003678633C
MTDAAVNAWHGRLDSDDERTEMGERVPQEASPRGTFLKIAEAVKTQIDANPAMTELPTLAVPSEEALVSELLAAADADTPEHPPKVVGTSEPT